VRRTDDRHGRGQRARRERALAPRPAPQTAAAAPQPQPLPQPQPRWAGAAVRTAPANGGGGLQSVARARSHCRFGKRDTDSLSESSVKWISGGAKRQCDRTLCVAQPGCWAAERWRTRGGVDGTTRAGCGGDSNEPCSCCSRLAAAWGDSVCAPSPPPPPSSGGAACRPSTRSMSWALRCSLSSAVVTWEDKTLSARGFEGVGRHSEYPRWEPL
jgi:hypothetical protein